jgi:hypothetical protein
MESKLRKGHYKDPRDNSFVYVDVWMNEYVSEYVYHILYYYPNRDYRDQYYDQIFAERHLNEEYVGCFIPIKDPAELAKLLLIDMTSAFRHGQYTRPVEKGKAYI